MAWEILQGDVRERLQDIPEKSIQCVVTSPPYFGLRSYDGGDAEIGLEKTPDEYVNNMVEVFRGVWRALRDDGVVFLNLGDSYCGYKGENYCKNPETSRLQSNNHIPVSNNIGTPQTSGLKPKDLVGIPWRVAFALQADGWYLRQDIIWHKPNPMPESVTDRCTKAHEYIFLLSKSQKYFYDSEAIKEPSVDPDGSAKRYKSEFGGDKSKHLLESDQVHTRPIGMRKFDGKRNKRSVWTVATQPYKGAHFAVYPVNLIEPCILAGTSPHACEVCGSPWKRVVEKEREKISNSPRYAECKIGDGSPRNSGTPRNRLEVTTIGWQPTCPCDNKGTAKCKVLDPFAGSGTTLWVAESHGRDSKGIELNGEYVKLIEKRMSDFQQTIFSFAP